MTQEELADNILARYEDDREYHFHTVDREWIIEAMIEFANKVNNNKQMKTVKIGLQEWASEDLNVTKFRNGEDIPLVMDDKEWTELTTAAYCISPKGYYLYNWYAVNDPRGLAPKGFHVPRDGEWTELTDFLGGDEVAGKKMKTQEWGGTNESGFSALPGGYRGSYYGRFYSEGYAGNWWSSSASGTSTAWDRYLYSDNDVVNRSSNTRRYGFSVRCVKTQQNDTDATL